MTTRLSIRRSGLMALTMTIATSLTATFVQAAGGRHVSPSDTPPARHRVNDDLQDAGYGRAMIYRSGEMARPPRPRADVKQMKPAAPSRALHFLDTTLPIIIQGVPDRLEMCQARTAC